MYANVGYVCPAVPPASYRVPNTGMKETGDKSDSILEGSICWQKAETIIKSRG